MRSTHKVALSGTPIMNNTMDLYAQLNFLLPTLFGTREFFKKEYADPIDRGKSVEKAKLLSKITAPFLLRRTKEMVAKDLPEKIEAVLWCEMGEEQMEAYEAVKNKIRDSIFLNIKNEGLNKSKISVLAGMQKLRQVCNAPFLVNDDEITNTDSIKLEVLMDEINNNLGGKKVLVFSQFKGMLDLIGDRLRQEKIKFLRFDGDTVLSERRDLIDQFQSEESDINIFIISLKAGNAGITLTAASYVFLIDPWWNSAVEQQAIDRTHRIGQTKNVFAYKMVCKDTIEEKIIALQQKKKAVSESIISVEEGFVKNLSEEDISYLFS
ncbi:MAG: DEAD/DEAH box helicase [Bacteroidetes bacterium]|nr:DEAD/DEAH box helicase [Bacteroidota bacterium]